ncbi:MAG TPA: hypothetical protein VM936_12950 [Pyrinomonadaceae bacterium]|nr:hypothetical protein [Pyrinomonadaceae bacterium]
MIEGFDKEIDSLLRRTARAPAGARGNGASTTRPDTHLDADELAAFAEGALPEAARMNAVSHLADCGECRALAVNLTRAAGVETKLEKHAVAAAASPAREPFIKRGWLASIFAPRTLRYVAPALAVCLVAAVSFIAIRSRSGSGLVSLRDEKVTGARPSIATTESSSQPSAESAMNSNASANANTATTAPGTEGPTLADKKADEAAAPVERNKDVGTDAPDGSAGAPVAESKAAEVAAAPPPPPAKEEDAVGDADAPREAAKSAQPAAEVPAPKSGYNTKAGPSPAPVQTADELAYNESQQQQQRAAQKRGLEPQSPDGGARQRSAANNVSNSGALASTPRDDRDARSRSGASEGRRNRPDKDSASDSERSNASGESRSAAGHRFRREGGAWVDVNYKPSMSLRGVRRGTDTYRGLVADFPEIGNVAQQLGGEVIVVVRGRAYRIQ